MTRDKGNIMPRPITRLTALTPLVLAALTLVGCATMNVSSYVGRGIDLRRYHTFNWGPADTVSTGDPRLDNNPFFADRVRSQVERQLAVRGFEKTTVGKPDLLVHYHANVTQEVDVRDLDRPYTYCNQEDCRPFVYDAGTIFVDLVDPRTNTLVWRGWAEGSVEQVIDNQDWMERRIDESIARIMQRLPYPPTTAATTAPLP